MTRVLGDDCHRVVLTHCWCFHGVFDKKKNRENHQPTYRFSSCGLLLFICCDFVVVFKMKALKIKTGYCAFFKPSPVAVVVGACFPV